MTSSPLTQRRAPARTAAGDVAVTVCVQATDPISRQGVLGQLEGLPGVRIVDDQAEASVALVATDAVDDVLVRRLRLMHRTHGLDVVLVIGRLDPRALVPVVEAGVRAVLPRADATPQRLAAVLRAAARGQAELPPDLVRHLLDQVNRLHREVLEPRGLSFTGLTRRERDVLELVADGLCTREIAARLCWSERTIKNVLQELTIRLHLRNRTQAVAYAVRNGWI